MENGERQNKEDKITELYKFVVLSYLVFLGAYGEGYKFIGYLIAVACIFVGAASNVI